MSKPSAPYIYMSISGAMEYAPKRDCKAVRFPDLPQKHIDVILQGISGRKEEDYKLSFGASGPQGKNGVWKTYYKNAEDPAFHLLLETEYENDAKHGRSAIYFEDGELQYEAHYVEGVLHGPYYSARKDYDGSLAVCKGQYVEGKKEGEWHERGEIFFDENTIGVYREGKQEGWFAVKDKQDRLLAERYYEKGVPRGLWKKYDENGVLCAVTNAEDNARTRKMKEKTLERIRFWDQCKAMLGIKPLEKTDEAQYAREIKEMARRFPDLAGPR